MAHQSLYRRYRPQRFSEVRGQPIVDALRAAVAEDRVGHAYLFSGPRGTGKTSTARILAKALNCEDLQDGEPCCVCASCVAMQAGTSYDLQELDAASNNKVEDVRAIIERVALGSPGRTKVYILDEVHMLTAGASNALLKTLEEPPDHVVFVLATTDPQKVLPTIRSRTQHFEFHLLPADELADHVRWVIGDAGLEVDDSAVEHVLRAGGGSARDTLSFLDQAAAGGVSDEGDHSEALAEAVVAVDTAAALSAVAAATIAGRDPRVLGEALLGHLRDVFLVRMGGPLGHLSDSARARVEDWAGRVTDRAVTRALEEVGEALLAMRQAPDPRIPLEVALVRVTKPAAAPGGGAVDDGVVADLLARIERLEQAAAGAGPAPAAPAPAAPAAAAPPPAVAAPTPDDRPAPAPGPSDAGADPGDEAPSSGGASAARAAARAAAQRGASKPPPAARPERSATPPPPPPSGRPRPVDEAPAAVTEAPPAVTEAPAAVTEAAPAPTEEAAPRTSPAPDGPPARAERPDAPSEAEAGDTSGPSRPPTDASTAEPPEPSGAPAPAPTPAAPDEAPAPEGSGGSDLAGLWGDRVVPDELKGMAKALFKLGEVVASDADGLTIGLPNQAHLDRCQEKRPEAESALGRVAGRPVRLTLVVGGDGGGPGGDGGDGRGDRGGPGPASPRRPAPDEREEETIDPDELVDAPAQQISGVDRVTEAFPGAQVVDP